MTWEEIQVELNRIGSGSTVISGLLDRDEFWKSDGLVIFRTAVHLHEHGKSRESMLVIDALKQSDHALPQNAETSLRYLRADALHCVGRYAEAVAAYEEILKQEPSDVAYGNQALACWEMGEFQKALNGYLEAIKMNPLNAIAQRGAGEMLNRLDRPADAIPYLAAAVKLNPTYSAAYSALGAAYYNSEDWLKAYRALKRAVEIDPDDRSAAMGIAKIERHFELDT